MIRMDQPIWLDLEAGGVDSPWCSRVQVSKINSVSLVPAMAPDPENPGQGVIVEGTYIVRVNAEGDRHEFSYGDITEAQDEYARIMRVLDGDEQELH